MDHMTMRDMMEHLHESMEQRIERLIEDVRHAEKRAQRSPGSVKIVAVSKTFGPDAIARAAHFGLKNFGENRVQEARKKIPWCPEGLIWHMIGHIQTNKARYIPRYFHWVHSLDSIRLLEKLETACARHQTFLKTLIQIKLSPEPTKTGCPEQEVLSLFRTFRSCVYVQFYGLMTIPPYSEDPEHSRPFFRKLVEWKTVLEEVAREEDIPVHAFELSMGMSHDFEVAIEEGATIIRVGTRIFGERP